jgi:single-stranded-DNA-specific exonuclease
LIGKQVTASDISFQIAPRINSSGRLANTKENRFPLDLLLSSDIQQCGELTQQIEIHNDLRKELSREMQLRIERDFKTIDPLPRILISFAPENHQGVAGITAGHLTRKYYLPAVVGKIGSSSTVASCRSIPEFNLVSALDKVKEFFSHYGGHQLAAGFTSENHHLDELQSRLQELAEEELSSLDLTACLEIDAIVSMRELNQDLYKDLLRLEPTGEGNPTPVFVMHDVFAENISRVGKNKDHLKFTVSDGNYSLPAIGFGLGARSKTLPERFSIAFHFNENEFRGIKELQLQILDLKAS